MTHHDWKTRLARDGFAHIRHALSPADVEGLAALALQCVNDYAKSDDLFRTPNGVPLKLAYTLDKYPEFASLLGRAEVRNIVDELVPSGDSVLTWEDLLIKMPLEGGEVGAHQDIGLDPTPQTVHSLGISLHEDSDNPVYFLPGSHQLGPLTSDAVREIRRDCAHLFVPVLTQPGDIVIHNVHALHYSEPNTSDRPRATWYLEFRSLAALLERGPWDADWVYRRRAIWLHARQSQGDVVGDSEPNEVIEYLAGLRDGRSTLRVPHVTDTVRFDPTSPYYHFTAWNDDWKASKIATDGAHHVTITDERPLYPARFHSVEKFHEPGLAPVIDDSGAYHVTPDGRSAYAERYVRTFGFYEGRAAVHAREGWFHVLPDGRPLYGERYAWCGNFQEGRCPVRLPDGGYFHVTSDGSPAYSERYRYAGDFKDGHAVIQREDGKHTHIDAHGKPLHNRWFLDLDVYHKRHARARDSGGWHHMNMAGEPLYAARFADVEPFYNGQARVEGFDGSLSVINEIGRTLLSLRGPTQSPLEGLSGDMVGLWRTKTIHAAVKLGVFEELPASAERVGRRCGLHGANGARLLRALAELGLVRRDGRGVYHPTERGELLTRDHPLSLADAAGHWGEEAYGAWTVLERSLRTGVAGFEELHRCPFFEWVVNFPNNLRAYQTAMASYARHDYAGLADVVDFSGHAHLLDAGGGTGELAFALLRSYPGLSATVMDMPEVVELAAAPDELKARCSFVVGDLFRPWPVSSDAVVLARVLHDWPDNDALRILRRARQAMPRGGALYVVEMALDEDSGAGGLLDLHMLVMTGGSERTERQFGALLAQAGFEMLDVTGTESVSSVIRARAV